MIPIFPSQIQWTGDALTSNHFLTSFLSLSLLKINIYLYLKTFRIGRFSLRYFFSYYTNYNGKIVGFIFTFWDWKIQPVVILVVKLLLMQSQQCKQFSRRRREKKSRNNQNENRWKGGKESAFICVEKHESNSQTARKLCGAATSESVVRMASN